MVAELSLELKSNSTANRTLSPLLRDAPILSLNHRGYARSRQLNSVAEIPFFQRINSITYLWTRFHTYQYLLLVKRVQVMRFSKVMCSASLA